MAEMMVKCLTVKQPWASWIMGLNGSFDATYVGNHRLPKDVENRTWATTHVGPLLIHAGKTMDWDGFEAMDYLGFSFEWERMRARKESFFPKGVILGQVSLDSVKRASLSPWAVPDMFKWALSNPRAFDRPIPYIGRQGLFLVPVSALEGQFHG